MRRFRIVEAEQRTPEWFAARLGCITASRACDIVATIKSGEAAARRDLRIRLVCERLTNRPVEDAYTNTDMQRGLDLEPQARTAYEFATGVSVKQIGFLRSVEHLAGASPDGVIGEFDGLVELKCPRSARHLMYLREGGVPAEHKPQLLHQLWISGASFVDFVSFDPLMPERLQLFVVRLERDDKEIAEYEKKALAFLADVDNEVAAVKTMSGIGAVLREAVA